MLSTKLKEAAGNGADTTLYVDDVFSTYLYTGNGSTQTINNGVDLAGKGGLVWTKLRSDGGVQGVQNHTLLSSDVGLTKFLYTNTTAGAAEQGLTMLSYASNGYSIQNTNPRLNYNSFPYVSWTFRKAAKFFDVVTYTGTGSARTIAHSLGVAPGMVIVKRTDTTGNWQVYSNGLTSAEYSIQLNLTNAQASAPTVWNSTAPTSSVFSVGTDATVNASGGTYVAYLYAHDTSSTGIIQCGSFTTDGSGNATVNLGWEPQYLMVKQTNTTTDWWVVDSMRGFTTSYAGQALYPNLSSAENPLNAFKPTATGFQSTGWAASQTFIYMAIRMPNKPPTSGTQVYNAIARTGTGAPTTVTGVGFSTDLLLTADRPATQSGAKNWFSRLVSPSLRTTSTNSNAEVTASTEILSFTMDGASIGTDINNQVNYSAEPYINWYFKRAPGFFDEVCYTGTGSATTQAHNLGVVPELMIVKWRSGGGLLGASWAVYHKNLGANAALYLNSTIATLTPYSTYWNDTAPTSSVFSIGTEATTNYAGGATYVAYLFATLAGISKVGSYTGNGTGQAIACGFSAGARFVLIKRTDSTGDWYTFDSARGLTSGSSPYLLLNSAATEVTGNNGVYASTGGFTFGSTASTTTNINAATYIFLAVA